MNERKAHVSAQEVSRLIKFYSAVRHTHTHAHTEWLNTCDAKMRYVRSARCDGSCVMSWIWIDCSNTANIASSSTCTHTQNAHSAQTASAMPAMYRQLTCCVSLHRWSSIDNRYNLLYSLLLRLSARFLVSTAHETEKKVFYREECAAADWCIGNISYSCVCVRDAMWMNSFLFISFFSFDFVWIYFCL